MKPQHLKTLKTLALLGALNSRISVSSSELGGLMGMSQQSAARLTKKLREEGLIDVDRGRRSLILITDKGRSVLMQEYSDYRAIFGDSQPLIKGIVESGLGEGSYYLSKRRYVEQIEEILGFTPYPGTLNIRLKHPEMTRYRSFLEKAFSINGFVSEGRTFGDVLAVRGSINGMECAIITPKRSHYSDVVEIIAPVRLRDALHLEDGEEIEIKIL